jgi:hypothetical protein
MSGVKVPALRVFLTADRFSPMDDIRVPPTFGLVLGRVEARGRVVLGQAWAAGRPRPGRGIIHSAAGPRVVVALADSRGPRFWRSLSAGRGQMNGC